MVKIYSFDKNNILKTPQECGVYIFYDNFKRPLYVGKSISLKSRINSYTQNDLFIKTKKLISKTKYFSYILVDSEIESLLLEAKLVKNLNTKYNIQLKDDKNPLYIKITNDTYPKVLTARKIDTVDRNSVFFGPYPSSKNVKDILKIIRNIYPYSTHKPGKKPCLYSQINLCNPCPNTIESTKSASKAASLKSEYNSNIKGVKKFLNGDVSKLKNNYIKKMIHYSKINKFEKAAVYRDKIALFEYITKRQSDISSYLKNPNFIDDLYIKQQNALVSLYEKATDTKLKKIKTIECYDISHISGNFATASMVTFVEGKSDKSLYKHFRIKISSPDDYKSLSEVARRRIKHKKDWGLPDMIIVDGGRSQVKAFLNVFSKYSIPIIGTAKLNEKIILFQNNKFISINPDKNSVFFLQRIRNEAHRFARRYHFMLLKKHLLPTN